MRIENHVVRFFIYNVQFDYQVTDDLSRGKLIHLQL